jgi:hypothetical protein
MNEAYVMTTDREATKVIKITVCDFICGTL